MPLGIIELLTRIGEDNVRLQNLVESATNFAVRGKGKNRSTAITFLTSEMNPDEVFRGNPRNVGIVLWLPADLVKQAQQAHKTETRQEPTDR